MALVVDASVALEWVLQKPDSHLAQALAEGDETLLMPDFCGIMAQPPPDQKIM
jgi:hypothetical protein